MKKEKKKHTKTDYLQNIEIRKLNKGKGTVQPLMEVFHDTATGCHLPYGITQCYLLPDTNPSHAGRYSIYLPWRDGRLS